MLKTRTYERLKRMILDGHLRPGQKLAERELGARLKVSRTPVREAMSRLV
jgi:DNA-binding GntR family transcriptional regulator